MSIEGVDTVSRIPPQTLTANGKSFVCRYLPVPGTNTGYCLSAAEASSLLGAGVMLVANFETTGKTYRGGFNAGVADAQAAEGALGNCGIAGASVIFSVDEDTNDQGSINAYMDGCASVMGVGRVGLYHKYSTVMAAMQGGHCKYGWQTYAWSGGQLYSGCHIYQYNNNVTVAGYGVDLCKTIVSDTDFGQVGAAIAPPAPPPIPPGLNAAMVGMGATHAGYHLFGADGGVFTFGDAPMYGSLGSTKLNAPIVGGCSRVDGSGYYMTGSDGGVFTFGPGCPFLGSLPPEKLNAPIVAIIADLDGTGYWLVGSDGGVFTFESPFYGSAASTKLNAPVVGGAAVPGGYLLCAADGGVFTFGAAQMFGSLANTHLNKPIVSMAAVADGSGYILVGADGGVFTFGSSPMLGSLGGTTLNWPVVGVASDPDGQGYWLAAADGGVFSFAAAFYGSQVK